MQIKKYLVLLVLPAIFLSISCKNQPIFASIEQEIKLKSFSVEGFVVGLVKIKQTVYAANSASILQKSTSSDDAWESILNTSSHVQSIASDGENLFASFASGNVKYYNPSETKWNDIKDSSAIRIISGENEVIGIGSAGAYKITTSKAEKIPVTPKGVFVGAVKGCVGFTGGLFKIDDGKPFEGAPKSGIKKLCQGNTENNNTSFFVLADSKLYHYSSGKWTSTAIKKSTPISIFYFEKRKSVLIGCIEGYTEIVLNGNTLENAVETVPGTIKSTTPPASSTQYSSSIGSYAISPIIGISRGGVNEYAIFAGVAAGNLTRNTGLWGFYSDKKREWNRE